MAAAAAKRLRVPTRRGYPSPALSTAAPRSPRDPRALCTLSTTLRSGAGEDEIERIRREFEDAKRNYLSIPAAIKDMPKMNPQGIYVNKNVKLDDLHVYGFDYDYTLSHYSEHLQCLIYDLAKKHLVNELKYPESCLKYEYDRSFPVRGLYYDRLKGCLLKLDFFGSIEPDGCFFGRRKLSLSEIKELYGTRHIGRDQALQLVGLMDVFCFSESQVFRFLKMLREKGKKLFLLTNSPFYFVDGGMRYLLEDQHFDGNSWRELFDVVIAQANKPTFYNSDHPFRVYDTQKDTLAFTAVDKFLPDQVYYHGCLKSFLQITKWRGPEVIYFGDHLLSDLRGPSKAGWRTAAVIRELEDEIEIQNGDSYRFQQAKLSIIHDLLGKVHATVVSTEKDTGRESSFAYHIHQYADIYTSKLENFLSYAPESWLHPPHDIKIMPHNAKVPASLFSTS
ncbi:hypothetical protein PAHAL_2G270200 [Panicum hallii]|uniref:5'-nucleotidase n=1 Tax=Panicum hallii TaxID=206008 RepID=A0A2T8KQH6_9POAL|nr:hypothetical protein PAHAL_2G270200 [Panicum hallii]